MWVRVVLLAYKLFYRGAVDLDAAQSGRRLAQLHALFFAPVPTGAKTADLLQFVATSTTDQMGEVGRLFVDMIATFRFT
jgi:hypothetical protein